LEGQQARVLHHKESAYQALIHSKKRSGNLGASPYIQERRNAQRKASRKNPSFSNSVKVEALLVMFYMLLLPFIWSLH
jgi:hypothetical protein